MGHNRFMEYEILQNEILGNWMIVSDDWDTMITEDENLDPFETEEEATKYLKEYLCKI